MEEILHQLRCNYKPCKLWDQMEHLVLNHQATIQQSSKVSGTQDGGTHQG